VKKDYSDLSRPEVVMLAHELLNQKEDESRPMDTAEAGLKALVKWISRAGRNRIEDHVLLFPENFTHKQLVDKMLGKPPQIWAWIEERRRNHPDAWA
jgi:hypothetical protein